MAFGRRTACTWPLRSTRGGGGGGGKSGGTEVYNVEGIELRASDRIRWTRNDRRLGLFNSRTAEVTGVKNGRVSFLLKDGCKLELENNNTQMRHLDHAWASTVHAFQGRTVDNVIAMIEASHSHLTTQKSFYVEISRARDQAELVTDGKARLKEQLETAIGERVSALEGIGSEVGKGRGMEQGAKPASPPASDNKKQMPAMEPISRPRVVDQDLGLLAGPSPRGNLYDGPTPEKPLLVLCTV